MLNKLSIIMPIFEVKSYKVLFKECLNGLINQSFSDWELVMAIDGNGKIDRELVILVLKELNDKRIRLYSFGPKTVGPGILRNYCFKYTSGELLTFHDADDFSQKDRFKILVEGFDDNRRIIASYVGINILEAPVENKIKGCAGKTLSLFVGQGKIRSPMSTASSIMSRELFEEIGGFEHYRFSSDSILAIKLGYYLELNGLDGIPYVKAPLYTWNRRSTSITMDAKNSELLRKCIKRQRKALKIALDKQKVQRMSKEEARKALGIVDNLVEDKKKDLELVWEY